MKRWVFILGRQPDLGLAEVLSVLHLNQVRYTPERVANGVLAIECDDTVEVPAMLARLGGTIKIAEVNQTQPRSRDSHTDLGELLKPDSVMRSFEHEGTGRWTFGISVYGADTDPHVAQGVHDYGLDLKRYLKSRKRSARFVEPRGKSSALSSVVVTGNGLLREAGAEIVIVFGRDTIYRAQTRAVQDFKGYSDRDYGRPERNPKSGSLPPKLAQILINLAGKPKGAYIFDPFCGIGTVLQEGLLMGYQVGGSDVDTDQVARARTNLEWLNKTAATQAGEAAKSAGSPKVLQIAEAEQIKLDPSSVDAVITEGVLGPPRSRPLSPNEAGSVVRDVAALWKAVLTHWKGLLKPGAKVVLTLPVLQTESSQAGISRSEPTFVPLLDDLAGLGYRREALVPPQFASTMQLSARGTLVYSRPDQVVAREILTLKLI